MFNNAVYELNEEQQAVIGEIDDNKNVFITGPGGSGKSFLIDHIHRYLADKGKNVAVNIVNRNGIFTDW